tara:strand:+ start:223 stop:555 length:333 start_codon:yes stop_codon:yes gene_type:complete
MPPSGYNLKQSNHVVGFLESCSQELDRECREFGRSHRDGLAKEISDIERYCEEEELSPATIAVLQLTRAFYVDVQALAPADSDAFTAAVVRALDRVRQGVLGVKIDTRAA